MCILYYGGGDSVVGILFLLCVMFMGDEEVLEMGVCLVLFVWGVGDYALFVSVRFEFGLKVLEYAFVKSVLNSCVVF